jgi:hypothetical protein
MTAPERRRQPRAAAALALGVALCMLGASSPAARAAASRRSATNEVAVRVAPGPVGAAIPASFLGLSWETTVLGSPALTSPQLAMLLRSLGPGVLRIGGVSVDRTRWSPTATAPAPWQVQAIAPVDLEHLGALMRESGWRLLLTLNLGHPETPALVAEAVAAGALGKSLAGVAIGNEPDLYTRAPSAPFRALLGGERLREPPWGVQQYEAEITALRAALAAGGADAPLYGPDTAGPAWLDSYVEAEDRGLAGLAQHFYPLDRCHGGRLLERGASLSSLLSARVAAHEQRLLRALVRVAADSGLALRVDEVNSVACAGQPRVSDTFGAALWALDFSLLAAREGVGGVNFHGGLGPCAAGGIVSPWYSPLCELPDGQLRARPEYYALLALRSLEGCAFVPVTYSTTRRVQVFALRAPDGSLRVVVDDMELATKTAHHGSARPPSPVTIRISPPAGYTQASVLRLRAPAASSLAGATLGGASLAPDGSFPGGVSQPVAATRGSFSLKVAPASAAVLTLTAAH